ncbi:MAG: SDR family oxidoreductase [Eudoraea sp.]|nr:SDR family oxidoreductase [Eudoraea sp.]
MNKQGQNGKTRQWCLILGASSGMGLATAKKMSENDYGLILVHRDRKSELPRIHTAFDALKTSGCPIHHFNQDAIMDTNRLDLVGKLQQLLPKDEKIRILVHSIAKGNLKPMHAEKGRIENADFQLTLNAMALSLYDWTISLLAANLLDSDTRVISFTSEGNTKVWAGYGAVSAAKVTLEAISRQMAVELAPHGIKVNCIQAGVTDTPSLRMIPGSELLLEDARKRNPLGRLTQPEDVANVVYLLSTGEASWITGTVIKVDGGESLR